MRGIFVACPAKDCKKPLFKDAYLRPGSRLTIKCFHCGAMVAAKAEAGQLILELLNPPEPEVIDDEDDGVVIMNLR